MFVILISIGQVLTPYGDASQFVVGTCQVFGDSNQLEFGYTPVMFRRGEAFKAYVN